MAALRLSGIVALVAAGCGLSSGGTAPATTTLGATTSGATSGSGGQGGGSVFATAESSSSSAAAATGGGSATTGVGGAGGTGGAGGAPVVVLADCKAIHAADKALPSAVYTINPDDDGPGMPFPVYCEMKDDGGGWTLALKVDGTKPTFTFADPIWTNTTTFGAPDLDQTEAKLPSFNSVPFDDVRIGMIDGALSWIVVAHTDTSLHDVFSSGMMVPTNAGKGAWKSLIADPSLQANCNLEGFDPHPMPDGGGGRVRIGWLANEQMDCDSIDSAIGIGWNGNGGKTGSAGNFAACCFSDKGDRQTQTFAYVMVR